MKYKPHNMSLPLEEFVTIVFKTNDTIPNTILDLECLAPKSDPKVYRITGYISQVNEILNQVNHVKL